MPKPVSILQQLCSIPTAPFVEARVVRYIEQFVAARRRLRLSRDRFGNLLIELPARAGGTRTPRWVFTAHMDHPGFIARRMVDRRTLEADFRGGVDKDYFRGSRVRFFDADREITATMTKVMLGKDGRPNGATWRVAQSLPLPML